MTLTWTAAARRTSLIVAGVTAAALTIATPALAAPATGRDHTATQRLLDSTVTNGGVPGVIAEVRAGHRSWFGSAGVANTETGRQRQQQDRFRIGSTTKTFTATVVLQLAAERRLSLDDTVERRLPGLVSGQGHDGSKITIRQLLNQTSGIFNYVMDPQLLSGYIGPPFLEHRFDSYRPEQFVKIAMTHPPAFAPGTGWGYSNTNFVLAAMIIERVTGRPFGTEIRRRIAEPLGLSGTYMPGEESAIRGPHSRHYSKLMLTDPGAKVYDVTEQNGATLGAAGGMVSTTTDLNRFFSALLGGRLLPPALQREMFTTVSTDGGNWIPNTRYGLGVYAQQLPCGVSVWGHGGAVNGSWSYTMGSRDGRKVVSANTNGDWTNLIGTFTEVLQAEFCPA